MKLPQQAAGSGLAIDFLIGGLLLLIVFLQSNKVVTYHPLFWAVSLSLMTLIGLVIGYNLATERTI